MAERSIRVTDHAREQASRRGLDIEAVLAIVSKPEQVVPLREIRQARSGERHLIRVVVAVTDDELTVVTMYRTSKLDKYWRP